LTPDVVVRESERLDFGQLRFVRKRRQDEAQLLQRHVEHVHPVALPIVGLRPPELLQPADFSRRTGGRPSLAPPAGLALRAGTFKPAATPGRNAAEIRFSERN
jgi:hypothetical protein